MSSIQGIAASTQLAVVGFVAGVLGRLDGRGRGRSSAEYAGTIFVAVALVGVLILAANQWGTQITGLISTKIGEIGS